MPKTIEQLERDVSATIKLILTEMEQLAGLPPAIAAEPYALQDRRKRVVRKIWSLYKDTLAARQEE
jgi:hypothetical protein